MLGEANEGNKLKQGILANNMETGPPPAEGRNHSKATPIMGKSPSVTSEKLKDTKEETA
jgi:hypothetical protein